MLRDRFCFPDAPSGGADLVELRAFTHGLMPETVPGMLQRFAEDWRQRGVDAWNEVPNHWRPDSGERVGWWTLPTYLGDHFIAPLLAAPRGTCIWQPSVHATMQAILSAPETWRGGRTVVCTASEFPSVLHSVQRWQDLLAIDLRVVEPGPDGFVDPEAVLGALAGEAGDTVGMVALSHVGFTTGERLTDAFLREVAARAQDAGALFVLDGYHANATMPIDVASLGADVYLGGLLKEACGSAGNGFAYLREGLTLSPRTTGWFGDADPFGFRRSPAPHEAVRRRFLGGTTPVAALYHAVEGVRLLLEAGLGAVRAHSLALTARAIERADDAGLALRSPREAERRGAMVILEVEAADRLCAYLKRAHVYTDSRQGRYLRMAPWVWNTPAEVDRAFDAIEDALATGAYRRAALDDAPGPVT